MPPSHWRPRRPQAADGAQGPSGSGRAPRRLGMAVALVLASAVIGLLASFSQPAAGAPGRPGAPLIQTVMPQARAAAGGSDLSLAQAALPGPEGGWRVGDSVVFSVTVRNTLTASVTFLPLSEIFDPAHLAYVGADPSPDVVDEESGVVAWNDLAGTGLDGGQEVMAQVTFRTVAEGAASVIALVQGAQAAGGARLRPAYAPASITVQSTAATATDTGTPTPSATATGTPTPTPTATLSCADRYEPDNTADSAPPLPMDAVGQAHTFHIKGDEDWFRFYALWGVTYSLTTSDLLHVPGPSGVQQYTDTIMHLYDADGATLLAVNDDYLPDNLASRITWTARHDGWLYVQVNDFYSRGLCLGYTLTGQTTGARHIALQLPVVLAYPPVPPPRTPTATPTATLRPTATPTTTPTATPTVAPSPTTIAVPGLANPNGVAVDTVTHRVYVTSRANNTLYMLDGLTFAVLGKTAVCDQPWGVGVNPDTQRVYVSCFASGEIWVLDSVTLAARQKINLGSGPEWELTLVSVDPVQKHAFVASHARNALVLIDDAGAYGVFDAGGVATWGVAANPNLKRVYAGQRDSGTITTLDSAFGYAVRKDQVINACGERAYPYGLSFNAANNRLYVACSHNGSVNRLAVFAASASGLRRLADIGVGEGGPDGGAGVVVNPTTGHVFVTNSAANTVSVVSGATNKVIATVPAGANPFGAALDPGTGYLIVANRASNNLTVVQDGFAP